MFMKSLRTFGELSMKTRNVTIAVAVFTACATGAAYAHHSLSEFLGSDKITIEGTVKQFRFINPHPSVAFEITDEDGETEEWTLVMDDRWELVESGFSRLTFQPGDELIVSGRIGRVNRQSMYVSSVERPSDGFVYTEDEAEGEIREGIQIGDLVANSIEAQNRREPPSFNELDSNDDDVLSADELTTLYELLVSVDLAQGIAPSDEAFFAALDADDNGAVSEEEYDNRLSR